MISNSNISVSVIIPVFNAEKYLHDCIDSVINQTLKNIEIICIDDGSTDNSMHILQAYKRKDSRVIILTNKNKYAGTARNAGMKVAKGDYFAFLDSDDYYIHPSGLECLYHLSRSMGLDFIKCSSYLYDTHTNKVFTNAHYSHERVNQKDTILTFSACTKELLSIADVAWNGLYRADFLRENHIIFNSLKCVNDRSFFISCLICADKIMVTNSYLTCYRINLDNSLIGKKSQNFDCQIQSYRIIKKIVQSNALPISLQQQILKSELNQIFIWYEKLLSIGANVFDVEEQICKFIDTYDYTDVGDDYLKHFQYAYTFNRFKRRSKIVYTTDPVVSPAISVIIPTYNSVRYLSECIESILLQSFSNYEIICIDDGSIDKTVELLTEYAQRDQRFMLLQQNHQFAGHARNYAITRACGDYLVFIDSDDTIDENYLELLYAEALNRQADVVVSPRISWDGAFKKSVMDNWIAKKRLTQKRPFNYRDDPDHILCFCCGAPGGKIFNRKFVLENSIHFLDIQRSEDFYFVLGAIARAEKISLINTARYCYRRTNPNSLESTKDNTPTLFWDATLLFRQSLEDLDYFDDIKRSYLNNTLVRFSFNIKAIKTVSGFKQIFDKLLEIYDVELELHQHSKSYFFEGDHYKFLSSLVEHHSYDDYLFHEYKKQQELQSLYKNELNKIKSSRSYKYGRILTYMPRKLRGCILCYQQHGMAYTLNRIKHKLIRHIRRK